MSAIPGVIYDDAVAWVRGRETFSGQRFQRVMRVGFVMRDRLLIAMENNGVIRRQGSDRYEVIQ